MLNLVDQADIAKLSELAEPAVARSGVGTLLGGAHMPVPRVQVKEPADPAGASALAVAALAFVRPQATARPQASAKAELFGTGAQVAGLAKSALQQHISKVNYAHTTRIAALRGCGALGPHPARDPV